MKFVTPMLVLAFVFGSFAFAEEAPECGYWKARVAFLGEQITQTEAALKACQESKKDCRDFELLLDSLKDEKSSDEANLKAWCA